MKVLTFMAVVLACVSVQAQTCFWGILRCTGQNPACDADTVEVVCPVANQVFFDWDAPYREKESHRVEYTSHAGITIAAPGDKQTLRGNIPQSRIRYLEELPRLPRQANSMQDCLAYGNDSLAVEIRIQDFDPRAHTVVRDSENGFIHSIDGNSVLMGTDGNLPQKEYASIVVRFPDKELVFSPAYVSHLYEPDTNPLVVVSEDGKTLFIATQNSDGVGGYAAVWTVADYQVKSLFVLHSF